MQVSLWLIAKITPYPGNPRLNDEAVAAVAASIREFGFRQRIVVDDERVVIFSDKGWEAAHQQEVKKCLRSRQGPDSEAAKAPNAGRQY